MTTYEAWHDIVMQAKQKVSELGLPVWIYYRSGKFLLGEFKSDDHYAEVMKSGTIIINRQASKKLGKLWHKPLLRDYVVVEI